MKSYTEKKLNPSKTNLYDCFRKDYENVKSLGEILASLTIPGAEYEAALSISEDKDFQLYLKRSQNTCFVNNYFSGGFLALKANSDIQLVFNHYKAVAYMCAYLSKCEDECFQTMSHALKDALSKM